MTKLRFPLKSPVILYTTDGVIKCDEILYVGEILKVKGVEYFNSGVKIDGISYLDRNKIMGFSKLGGRIPDNSRQKNKPNLRLISGGKKNIK